MIRLFTTPLVLNFWASPHHSMDTPLALRDLKWERHASKIKVPVPKILDPKEPGNEPPPVTSFPTDVPAPEPHDIPAPEPKDVPPPSPRDPGAKPQKRSDQDPKPRPVP